MMAAKKKEKRIGIMLMMSEETLRAVQKAMTEQGWDNNPPNTFDRMVDLLVLHGIDQLRPTERPLSVAA